MPPPAGIFILLHCFFVHTLIGVISARPASKTHWQTSLRSRLTAGNPAENDACYKYRFPQQRQRTPPPYRTAYPQPAALAPLSATKGLTGAKGNNVYLSAQKGVGFLQLFRRLQRLLSWLLGFALVLPPENKTEGNN